LPVALLLALFNKISPVPFKIYSLRVDRIGQMAAGTEQFLCELDHGRHPREFKVYIYRDRPANDALLTLFKRVLNVRQSFLPLFDVCHKLGGLGVVCYHIQKLPGHDPEHLVEDSPQHLFFTREEDAEARRQCAKLGIDPDKPFILALSRDNAYLEHIGEPTSLDSYRNTPIESYLLAMEHLADHYQVIRMGSVATTKLETNHPNILDYAFSGRRTELLDVYLSAKCFFFLSCGSGIDSITTFNFRRPALYVQYIPPGYFKPQKQQNIIILKKYWHTKKNRYLSMNELFEKGICYESVASKLFEHDVVVHDNTPEEILEAAQEMAARLEGTWVPPEGDSERQRRFKATFNRDGKKAVCLASIGAAYLEKNQYWLDS
jgi:putative glycosyltransferase (TIGR04372 family)